MSMVAKCPFSITKPHLKLSSSSPPPTIQLSSPSDSFPWGVCTGVESAEAEPVVVVLSVGEDNSEVFTLRFGGERDGCRTGVSGYICCSISAYCLTKEKKKKLTRSANNDACLVFHTLLLFKGNTIILSLAVIPPFHRVSTLTPQLLLLRTCWPTTQPSLAILGYLTIRRIWSGPTRLHLDHFHHTKPRHR